MRCMDCSNMKIVSIEDGFGAAAKCYKTSKRGKTITWAMTTITEKGEERVAKAVNSQRLAPFWCPRRKQRKGNA